MLSVATNTSEQSAGPIEEETLIVSRPPRSRQSVMISMSRATMNDMDEQEPITDELQQQPQLTNNNIDRDNHACKAIYLPQKTHD